MYVYEAVMLSATASAETSLVETFRDPPEWNAAMPSIFEY